MVRFSKFQQNTGAAKTILANRLARLVELGIFETFEIADAGSRNAYRLTEKGMSLSTILIAIHQWGNKQIYKAGNEPILLIDQETGSEVPGLEVRAADGAVLDINRIVFQAGPGATNTTLERLK